MRVFSRSDGHSAVAAAAYRARTSYFDHLRGRKFTYSSVDGLLSNEVVGWNAGAEELWNASEASETRSNSRVARELRPALPAELPLNEQIKLVRGFCLWLRDRYGVALQAAIHAPTFFDPQKAKEFWKTNSSETTLAALWDPDLTNRNFHAHILFTTRRVDAATGKFGEKTRELDDKDLGPKELKVIRTEWQKRTNSTLKKCGSQAKIDMRSYRDMAIAGDAPEGLNSQDHIGPRRTARGRKQIREKKNDQTVAGLQRAKTKARNDRLWQSWLQLRALRREKARSEASRKISNQREAERKRMIQKFKEQLIGAKTSEEAEAALAASHHLDSLLAGNPLARAIAAAQSKDAKLWPTESDSSEEIDVEVFELPASTSPKPVLVVSRVRVRQKVR
ncbi:MobA/MobL family protein [Shimia thalassica]|uniref:MobA/MobL family protein n=1 Tax=Shimia thalassica TaxID=1715693 RepID=UPI002736AB3F|nr:MobA/MobL family protein [Shimia thalassica]MDP2520923.1 MobA/MobL family protein [Shimia thalassica]